MGKLIYAEIGILIGLFLGLALMGAAWLFSKTADANFCPFKIGEQIVCIRFISLYPFVLALLGLIVGFICDKIREKREGGQIPPRIILR